MAKWILSLAIFAFTQTGLAQEYEVLPHAGEGPRGVLWLSDGPAYVSGGSDATVNRFRLGAGLELGADYRFSLGFNIIDTFSGGEKSREVGAVTRSASGFVLGYDLIPDRLCLNYTFHMHSVRGSRVTGGVSAYGHQLALNHRVYSGKQFRLGAELSYLSVPEVSVPVLDATTNTTQNATFPSAEIVTLALVMAINFN